MKICVDPSGQLINAPNKNTKFFLLQNKNKNVEKIEQKKKDIILKVKINNFDLDIQIDTGCEVTLMLRNF